jgi:hypothetical protein
MSDQDDSITEPEEVVDPDPADDDQGEPEGADQLGDAGKKALDAMKTQRNKAREERNALKAELDKLRGAQATGDKPDADAIRTQAQAEARAEVLRERVLDRIEAKAARLFADPEDAVALLGRRADEFVDGGKVDNDELQQALEDLLAKKPHLAAAKPARFQGGADGGARKGSKPDQLTEQDLKRMTPQQIDQARLDGRLNDLLGVS